MTRVELRRRPVWAIAAILLVAYFVSQTVVVVAHEFTHSTSAWALGYTKTPLTVVWGNPITMQGWDEGVPYDVLFPRPGNIAEAVIGGSPLLLHVILATALLALLRRPMFERRALLFVTLYWAAVVNVAELTAYILMRPFIPTGDTGRFNQGMNQPPWILFIVGMALIAAFLWELARRAMPRMTAFTDGRWAVLAATGFVIFLWASGLRFMVLYPNPLWRNGLVGAAGFLGWLSLGLRRGRREG